MVVVTGMVTVAWLSVTGLSGPRWRGTSEVTVAGGATPCAPPPAGEPPSPPAGGAPPREVALGAAVLLCLVVTVGSFFAVQPLIDVARSAADALPL